MSTGGVITHRVLVVDDDRDECEFLKTFLSSKGFKVEIARDGGQAHSAFVMHRPDFVLLDIILPRESGYEICERLKGMDAEVPVMMLTAIDFDDARKLAERVRADAYLTKPYDPDELVEKIHEVSERMWKQTHSTEDTPMPEDRVHFTCGDCGKRMKVKAIHRGRTLNCVNCGQPVIVPRHD